MTKGKQTRYVADLDEGEFYRREPCSRYEDTAAVWEDSSGRLKLATGEDGFGLTLDPEDLKLFIDFLQAFMAKIQEGKS